MPPPAKVTVSAHLRTMPMAERSRIQAARRMVMAAAPNATEIAYQSHRPRSASGMWKIARYALEGINVIGIGTFSSHSTIFFYRGRQLEDGTGLLEGGGKDARFITLRTPADAERPAVRRMVRKAFKLSLMPDAD
jgi:hypothetical protein